MRLATLLVPLALSTFLAVPAFAQDYRGPGTISIEGHGEVTGVPDTAYVTSGVTTQGATAAEALAANSKAMTDLIATLKASGIEERDIQTSGFSVSPNYVYTDQRDANGYTLPPKINGYQVYNTVTVRVRQIATLGAILDKSVTVGANTINGVTFDVAEPARLYEEARRKAFADARDKARLYADEARIDLGRIRSITETQYGGAPPQPYMMKEMAMSADAMAVPVQAGEMSFAINVQVTWELDD
jgi:uncharacterized protein YggE